MQLILSMANFFSRTRNASFFAPAAVGLRAKTPHMFKPQFGSAFTRLFALLAFALCFSGLAHAQQRQVLTLTAQPAELEGADANFLVTLSGPATQRLTFSFVTNSGSGPTGALEAPQGPFDADYDGVSTNGNYTIEEGATQLIIEVPTNNDTSYEFDETFNAQIFNPRFNGQPAGNIVLGQSSAVQTINNDDAPPSISLNTPPPILEGDLQNRQRQNYNFSVNIGNTVENPDQEVLGRPITLAFTTRDGTATSNGVNPGQRDFEAVSNDIVQVPAGTRQFQYTVIVLGDDVYEGDENFSLRVEYSPPLADNVPSVAVGNIRDNDLPTYSVAANDEDSNVAVEEGNPIAFVVRLLDRNGQETPALQDITFTYRVQDVSATKGPDFTDPNNGTFTIRRGQSRFRLVFPTLDDNAIEQTETFRFVITNAPGTRTPEGTNSNVGTGTIFDTADNNVGTIFTIQDETVVEGTGGANSIQFTVNLSRATSQSVTVDYETFASNNSTPAARAVAGTDFTPTSGRLVFAPNQTVRTFTVPIATDSINELDETFRVRLFNPSNASFANNAPQILATGTIIDDDAAGVVSAARSAVDVPENVSGRMVNILVNFTPDAGTRQVRPVTVNFTTIADTAQQEGQRDYFGKSGTLTFRPGVTQQAIAIEIVNDNVREGDESFLVSLSNPNGATLGAQSETRVTIKDNEALPLVRISTGANTSYAEAKSTQNFVLTLLSPSQSDVTVGYKFVDGTATNNSDYVGKDGVVTFRANGPQSIPVEFDILDDGVFEGNEKFTIQLTSGTGNIRFEGNVTSSVITIVDSERKSELTIGDARVEEGNTGNINTGNELVFPVTLNTPGSRPVTFRYSTLQSSQASCTTANSCVPASDADYAVASDQVVTIAPGQTTAEIRVRVAPDALNEYNEQFAIVARSLVNATASTYTEPRTGVQRSGTTAFGTIVNDDAGGAITISGPTGADGKAITSIAEGYNGGTAQRAGDVANFTVTLPAPTGRRLVVNYSFAGGKADASDVEDLTTRPGDGQITFGSGTTTSVISVRANADKLAEGSEVLRVTLSIQDTNGANSYTARRVFGEVNILDRTPQVTSVTPTVGFPAYGTVAATRVTINGSQFRTNGDTRVRSVLFNNGTVNTADIQYVSDDSIAVSVPANAKTGPLSVRLVDGSVITTLGLTPQSGGRPAATIPTFIVQPVIDSFSPTVGVVNATTIAITGRNFQDGNNSVRAVQFSNGTRVSVGQGVTVVSDTRIDLSVPAGANSGPLAVVSTRGGVGPVSQNSFSVVGATPGRIREGENPDRNGILEGSTGDFERPVRNVNGTGDNALHRPYQFFLTPATQVGGANNGSSFGVTPLTVQFKIEASTSGNAALPPDIAVSADLTGNGRPTLIQNSGGDGIIEVRLSERFNPANPIEVAIIKAGTDDVPPIAGATPAKVTVTARIVNSENPTFYPNTPSNQVPTITVDRVEPVTNENQTAIAFGPNTRANFSVPFAVGNTNSVAITDVFNVTPVASNGDVRYRIFRLNVANQSNNLGMSSNGQEGSDFVEVTNNEVPNNGRLERGIGYRLVVTGEGPVQLNTKKAGLVTPAGDSFSYSLTRNVAFASTTNNQGNSTNGYNFIGFPFDASNTQSLDFNRGEVTFNGVTRSVPDAVAAGLINSQLYTINENGAFVPANTTVIQPFQAYFVQIFRDNLTLTFKKSTN